MTGKKIHDQLEKALNYDSVNEAEKIFGKNTKESQAFGLGNFLENNKKKRKMLEDLGDTPFSCKTTKYLQIVGKFGFEIAYKENIIRKDTPEDYNKDTLYILWHDELGILLKFDTYGDTINGGDFYYNWFIPYSLKHHSYTSNGGYLKYKGENTLKHYDKNKNLLDVKELTGNYSCPKQQAFNENLYDTNYGIYIGHTDCREAVIYNINRLKNNGELLSQWEDIDSCFNLCCGNDYREDTYYLDESLRRLKLLPDNVKQKICYDKIIKQHNEWKKMKM